MKHFHESFGPPPRAGLLLLAALCLTGCGRETIAVYRTPKEPDPEVAAAQGTASAVPHIHGKAPDGWQEQPAAGMSIVSFLIPGDAGRKAKLSVMTFPGEGAGELSLVNIVRENAGLPPLSDDEMARAVEPVEVGSGTAKLVDLTGAAKGASSDASPNRILVAVFPRSGVTWFFKLAGDAGVVTAQKKPFLDFLKSVSFVDSGGAPARGTHLASTNAKRIPGGGTGGTEPGEETSVKPAWEVPAGWQEVAAGQMMLARFQLGGGEGKAEVTVSVFPGDTGGVLANVNRWRGQVGLTPVAQAEADRQIVSLDVMNGKAMLVDVNGRNARTAAPARLIGVIVPRAGQTWFYKLTGAPVAGDRGKDAFIKFVKSVRYPNV